MATGLMHPPDRRAGSRVTPDHTPWQPLALLRPGQEVTLINLCSGGALLESRARMHPGTRGELQLFGDVRWQVRGRITRCRVVRVAPLCYQAAIVFEERLDVLVEAKTGSRFP